MLASAGGLFTSLLSWSIPQSVQKRVVCLFLRNTLGKFVSQPDLNLPDSFEFHDGALLLQSLEFDAGALQEILPYWVPSIQRFYIECIRVQLPWPNIFNGTVHVTVQSPLAMMLFKNETDTCGSPSISSEMELNDFIVLENDIPKAKDFEHPDIVHEASSSTFENLVASFGKALIQRLRILVNDVEVHIGSKKGEFIFKVDEFSFDGEKENMSCSGIQAQALRPRTYTTHHNTNSPVSSAIPLNHSLSEKDAPDYVTMDILRIEECMKFHVSPGNSTNNKDPLISLESPSITFLASNCDLLFCFNLIEELIDSLQISTGSSDNALDVSIGSASFYIHVSSFTTQIFFDEEERASNKDVGALLTMDCQNLVVEGNYDGSRISSSTCRIEQLVAHEIFKDGVRVPIIRILAKHGSEYVIPADPLEWSLGSRCFGQGKWTNINPLPSSHDQAITLCHSGSIIHLDMAPIQFLFDLEMLHRVLPFLKVFDTSCSDSLKQSDSSILWSFVHKLLTYVPIMSISCEKGQMVLKVPQSQMSDSTYNFKPSRSGLWLLECDNIHTLNSRSQEISSRECISIDTSRVSIFQSSDCEFARCFCDFRASSQAPIGIQINISLSSMPSEECTADLHLDVFDLVIGLDNPFVQSMYYLADDFFIFASTIASLWTHMSPEFMQNSADSAPRPETESRPSIDSFSAGASIHISLHHGMPYLTNSVQFQVFSPGGSIFCILKDATISSQLVCLIF